MTHAIRKFLLSILLAAAMLPALAFADSSAESNERSFLSAFMAYTDLRINSLQQSLEILAASAEAKSRNWEKMKGLLGVYQKLDDGFVVWYVRTDGAYYTVEKGLMDVKLTDRSYFPDLMAGRKVVGALVISRSTGQRSAVVAVPIKEGGKVVGAIGASLFLDKLSDQMNSILALRSDAAFFSLAANGLTTLHRKADRHFLDPREMGSETLKKAADEMLSRDSGETTYEFDNATKKAIYRTSPLTRWKFAITFSAVPRM